MTRARMPPCRLLSRCVCVCVCCVCVTQQVLLYHILPYIVCVCVYNKHNIFLNKKAANWLSRTISDNLGVAVIRASSAPWLGLAPATLEFWVRFPNERNQGKQAHPVLKYRDPHGSHQPLSPPRPPPSHIHAGWMVSATRMPTCSAPSQDYLFPLYM